MKKLLAIFLLLSVPAGMQAISRTKPSDYVDPRIGSEGVGRVYVGPTMPYGMIKPSVDCVSMPNSGFAPMPERIRGFSQLHVSGTGGGQKYGNILVTPFLGFPDKVTQIADSRLSETISLGYYSARLEEADTGVEITSADKSAIYRFSYPVGKPKGLAIDCGFFLGMSPVPDQRETQQFVGSQIEVVSDTEVRGYSRVRGGWNNGRAYTVYFCAFFDRPFSRVATWKGDTLTDARCQSDTHQPTGAYLGFGQEADTVKMKIGISFLSELKARDNVLTEIQGWDFEEVRASLLDEWNGLLSRVELDESTPTRLRRMFYTGLYHTMIMPSDRSGENPLWADDDPYYDDFYAIWDTYRTSSPMITLLDPQREIDMVNSLINIYRRDGYLPDARSGNANGRTQGGSNAEVVIADAFVKGLGGIDYEMGLEAMIKDAEVPPGGNEEAEGRGGIREYNELGYIPYGIPRAGNRTVEYSLCDYAISEVARGLGRDELAEKYRKRSSNWKNLWRDDCEHAGVKGFIMPRDASGQWLDSLPYGDANLNPRPKFAYDPMTFEGPWHVPWWDMFFYEAPSWEYSLSVPHDVPGLIEMCGGADVFEKRLDTFFSSGFYNVGNEPSFLSPCLYHWIGKPYKSSDRISEIVSKGFDDSPGGIPGNDDSGAMSSWLAFHILGLYPNAGTDYYLINSPMVSNSTIRLADGKEFHIIADGFADDNPHVVAIELNGKPYDSYFIKHSDIVAGGELRLIMGRMDYDEVSSSQPESAPAKLAPDEGEWLFSFRLHGQTRRYRVSFVPQQDGGVMALWGIRRNLEWHSGSVEMDAKSVSEGSSFSFRMPVNGDEITLPAGQTFLMISDKAFRLLKTQGRFEWGGIEYERVSDRDGKIETLSTGYVFNAGTAHKPMRVQMTLLDNPKLPLVLAMDNNPANVNWSAERIIR